VDENVCKELKHFNVRLVNKRIEEEKTQYDFIVSRAVTEFNNFVSLHLKTEQIRQQ
jgi:16S rRNA G527 N7-methylase RsmG